MNKNPNAETWEQRMVRKVSEKLGTPVSLSEWQRKSNGIHVPIFSVPETHRTAAINLGLSIQMNTPQPLTTNHEQKSRHN